MTTERTTEATRTPGTVAVPGAVLSYTVIGDLADATPEAPPLLLGGSPMDSTGFGSLAAGLEGAGRVLVLTDPRNVGRSTRDDDTAAVTPEQHAEDLHAVIEALGVGQVDFFATSGAAVNALFLVAAHPDDVRLLVAHEPPMAAMFGLPTEDDGSRNDGLMANMRGEGCTRVPDLDAIRRSSTTVVIGVGEESGGPDDGEIAGRAGHAVARELGLEPVVFPGGHNGFLGGEYGQTGKPEEFAAKLRTVLEYK
jgi:pimeloyl-ACP methyl ester carboxylesterase